MRVTKIIKTETAHRLMSSSDKDSNLHGHSYKWEVTVKGEIHTGNVYPEEEGMVISFSKLRQIMIDEIARHFDHAVILQKGDPLISAVEFEFPQKTLVISFPPTTENFAAFVADRINLCLYADVKLVSVKVWETSTSYAEWRAEDETIL